MDESERSRTLLSISFHISFNEKIIINYQKLYRKILNIFFNFIISKLLFKNNFLILISIFFFFCRNTALANVLKVIKILDPIRERVRIQLIFRIIESEFLANYGRVILSLSQLLEVEKAMLVSFVDIFSVIRNLSDVVFLFFLLILNFY